MRIEEWNRGEEGRSRDREGLGKGKEEIKKRRDRGRAGGGREDRRERRGGKRGEERK